MFVQIGGRTMQMDVNEWLSLSDADIQDYIAHEQGFISNSPYVESALIDLSKGKSERVEEEELDEYEDDSLYDPEQIRDMLDSDSFGTC